MDKRSYGLLGDETMAISYSEQSALTCPSCGREFEATLWLVVDAQERPDLVEALRAGQLDSVTCPHCAASGPTGAPLLFHDAATRRVLFAPSTGAAEYEVREQARELMATLVSNLPEEQQAAYLGDVHVTQDIDGMRAALEKEERRRRARAGAAGQQAQPVQLPPAATRAVPTAPREEELPPLLLGVHELLNADTGEQIQRVLTDYPELLAPDADQTLAQLASIAVDQREHEVAEALAAARKVLGRLRMQNDAPTVVEEHLAEEDEASAAASFQLSEAAYTALLQASTEEELLEATRAHPALLEPWVDTDLEQRIEAALDLGDDHGAQAIEDRREALAVVRNGVVGNDAMLDAIRALLSADEQDDIAVVLDAHPILLSDLAQEALWSLSAEARAKGDDDTAAMAIEYRALLREVRQGMEE